MNPSYAFIYDDFLTDPRYGDAVAALETRLATLGLSGQIGRLTLFRSAKELVEHHVHQGAKTIVLVGNDNTLNKVMWFLPDLPVILGYLPVAEPTDIATLLGIPPGLPACDTLGARLIETLDMGKLGDRYFLTEAVFERTRAKLAMDDAFTLSLPRGGDMALRNLGGVSRLGQSMANARDGLLEAVLVPNREQPLSTRILKRLSLGEDNETHVFFKSGTIASDSPIEGHADLFAVSGFEFKVSVVPNKLRVIMGRGRRVGVLGNNQNNPNHQ